MTRHTSKRISLYNHKGGVGKTTLTANIAAAIAGMGKKVLLVDSDPQANLTSYLIEDSVVDSWLDESSGSEGRTIWTAMVPVTDATGGYKFIEPYETSIENLSLLPGDIKLAEFELYLNDFWGDCFKRFNRGYNGTMALSNFVNECAHKYNYDYIFYDTGPNIGPLNRVILLDSDFFIVPAACDLYSKRALKSLGHSIANWVTDWKTILQLAPEGAQLFNGMPQFLGYIPQRFKIYGGNKTAIAATYLAALDRIISNDVVNVLRGLDSALVHSPEVSSKLGDVKDFSTLVQQAQEQGVPLDLIEGGDAGQKALAKESFEQIARKIIELTQ